MVNGKFRRMLTYQRPSFLERVVASRGDTSEPSDWKRVAIHRSNQRNPWLSTLRGCLRYRGQVDRNLCVGLLLRTVGTKEPARLDQDMRHYKLSVGSRRKLCKASHSLTLRPPLPQGKRWFSSSSDPSGIPLLRLLLLYVASPAGALLSGVLLCLVFCSLEMVSVIYWQKEMR